METAEVVTNETASPKTLKDAAMDYARRGLKIFPVYEPTADGCSCGRDDCASPGKHPRTRQGFKDATDDLKQIEDWWTTYPNASIGLATGSINGFNVVDVDPRNGGDETLRQWEVEHGPLPLTPMAISGGGGPHFFLRHPGQPIKSRTIAPGIDLKADGGYVVAAPSRHVSGQCYRWEGEGLIGDYAAAPDWLMELASGVDAISDHTAASAVVIGERNCTLTSMAGRLRWDGATPDAMLLALREANTSRCTPPLSDKEVSDIARSIGRYPAGRGRDAAEGINSSPLSLLSQAQSWPDDLAPEALYGLPGRIVKTLEPHSEADPAALLGSLLAGSAIAIGSGPHFEVESDRHGLRLDIGVVGKSAKARKGMSWNRIKRLLSIADAKWVLSGISNGLSTGEGLIWAVRDPIIQDKMVKGKEELEIVDEGVKDKRLLVVESELGRVLKVMQREGNTLSSVLRQAWDTGDLRVMTRANPCVATGAHIGVIGHITIGELLRYLNATESTNGFGNRFLWIAARRSKLLPHGGSLSDDVLQALGSELAGAVEFAKNVGRIERDAEARDMWEAVYPALTADQTGIFGAIVSRAEAQVSRLSCLYALLDHSSTVKSVHLQAALAFWKRAEDSARYIFGDKLGDPVADKILSALRKEGSMTQTAVSALFSRHESAYRIETALGVLVQGGLIHSREVPTGGRPEHRWVLGTDPAKKEKEAK